MIFKESDINFSSLDHVAFEELCFDLLARLGFQELQWRRAAADSGRDIEGKYMIQLPLVGPYREKWAVECKHHTRGVPPEALSSKLAWAETERPDRLLILISSHLTNSARAWLKKREQQISTKVHVIEGKALRQLLLSYEDLVECYFGDQYSKLLRQAIESWILFGVFPSWDLVKLLIRHLDLSKLTLGELGFLWCVCLSMNEEIYESEKHNDAESPYVGLLKHLRSLAQMAQNNCSLLEPYKKLILSRTISYVTVTRDYFFFADFLIDQGERTHVALYGLTARASGDGLEVLVLGGTRPEGIVRYIQSAAYEAFRVAEK